MPRRTAFLTVVGALLLSHPAHAQDAPDGFAAVESGFNTRLSVSDRLVVQNAMIAAGYLNAVPSDRFSLRLFRGLQRLQRDNGVAPTGIPDAAILGRAFSSAAQMYDLWDLRRFTHPVRSHSIIMPTGFGLQRVPYDGGIAFADADKKLRVRFSYFPDTSAAQNFAELVSKYERNNVKINYKTMKDGWFVISTTSSTGIDGYLRYHTDGGGILGFAIFWDNQKGNIGGERIATLMSASLWSEMTGAPFVDPPASQPRIVSRETSPASIPAVPPAPPSSPPPSPRPEGRSSEPNRVTTGTGFFVSADGFLVTNNHVVTSCSTAIVQTVDKTVRLANVVATDPTNDLALLKIDANPSRFAALRSSARLGEDVAAFGFPHSDVFASSGNFTIGTITATAGLKDDTRFFQISAPVHSGNSGGPLFDDHGNVVGVVTSKLNAERFAAANGDVPQNVNFAVKTNMVSSFLDGHGLTLAAPSTAGQRLERPDLAELARQVSGFVACKRD